MQQSRNLMTGLCGGWRRTKPRILGKTAFFAGVRMKRIFCVLAALTVAACHTFTVPPYSVTLDNDRALKATLGERRVAVGPFTMAAPAAGSCRAGSIEFLGGMTFEAYVQTAFTDELRVAGLYDPQSPITVRGKITQLSFSSGIVSGAWDIGLTLESSNGKTLSASEHYEFPSSFEGGAACRSVADAFRSAVQALIGKVAAAPEFHRMAQK
jgi:hypothetical protein